jgi:hypothetical protein
MRSCSATGVEAIEHEHPNQVRDRAPRIENQSPWTIMKTTMLKSAWRVAWLGLALWPAVLSVEFLLAAVADGAGGSNQASQAWDMVIPLKTAP